MEISLRLLLVCSLAVLVLAEEIDDHRIPDSGIGDDEEEEINLDREESRSVHPRAYQTTSYVPNSVPTGFRPSQEIPEHAARRPVQHVAEESYINLVPVRSQNYEQQQQQPARVPHRKLQQQDFRQPTKKEELLEELEDEKEEPDRLTLLLQDSKFDCTQMQTGYYADEPLACEVFHYCHDGVKHSWICPNGFTFHQVHLICMPPSQENICQKSSKYHFVNEYLYRPINAEEAQRKPNVTLRYSDRYFPSDIYHDDRYDDEEEQEREPPRQRAQQVQQQARQQHHQQHQQHHQQQQQQQQVFRNPEDVNISLLQRRPSIPNYPSPRPNTFTTPADEFEYQ